MLKSLKNIVKLTKPVMPLRFLNQVRNYPGSPLTPSLTRLPSTKVMGKISTNVYNFSNDATGLKKVKYISVLYQRNFSDDNDHVVHYIPQITLGYVDGNVDIIGAIVPNGDWDFYGTTKTFNFAPNQSILELRLFGMGYKGDVTSPWVCGLSFKCTSAQGGSPNEFSIGCTDAPLSIIDTPRGDFMGIQVSFFQRSPDTTDLETQIATLGFIFK